MTPAAPAPSPFGARFAVPLLLASTLNPINSSMLATGLTALGDDLEVDPGTAALAIAVLYLTSAVALPVFGRLGLLFGARRMFVAGLAIVLVGGLVGTLAGDFATLLVARAVLGLGTAAAFPTAMALIRRRADATGAAPTRLLGWFAISAQLAFVVGLPLGGLLTGVFGWRALLAVNLPLATVALVVVLLGVERDPARPRRTARGLLVTLDLPGVALFAGAVTTLLLFLDALETPTWWLLAVGVGLVAALVAWELHVAEPFVDVRALAANGPLVRTYLRQVVGSLAVFTALYGVSQWMTQAGGLDAVTAGLVLMPLSVASIALARLVSTRGWVRGPVVAGGVAIAAAGALLLAVRSDAAGLVPLLVAVSCLFGAAHGLTNVAAQTALYVQAPADAIGVAAGLQRTFGFLGAIYSSSLIGVTFGARATDGGLHLQALVILGLGAALALLGLDRGIPVRFAEQRPPRT